MNVYEIIKKKRDGVQLSKNDIEFIIDGLLSGDIPDYQVAAFLMAVYFNGMSNSECFDLTMAMTQSGEQADLTGIKGFKVDKHSTGGVGDTTTLVLAPLVAASGGIVAKMTGRELGHTGGTVDKLESIPGMRVALHSDEFVDVVNRIHVSLISQTARLAPADKHLYALRNATATVDSIPLIAASIMSKKLASGSDGIVLDVKTGQGAFMPKYDDALELANTMVNIGEEAGKRMVALVTAMHQPLGRAIGNSIEVVEAIETLAGNGPPDLVALVTELGAEMLLMSGVASTREAAKSIITKNLANRRGLDKLAELITAQGGDRAVINNPDLLPQPGLKLEIVSESSGYVTAIDALGVGMASKILGTGRISKDGVVDLSTGIYLNKKIGDKIKSGEVLAVFHSSGDNDRVKAAKDTFLKAYAIRSYRPEPPKLLYARITSTGVEEL